MREVSVTLQAVTPLFLDGFNPGGEPGLRALSLCAGFRFWLRALLGGAVRGNTQKALEAENQVFTSTQHASPVTVRVQWQSRAATDYCKLLDKQPAVFSPQGFQGPIGLCGDFAQ